MVVQIRTAINLGITAKKYYKRVSKLELNNDAELNVADGKKGDAGGDVSDNEDVDELNSMIQKFTQAPRVQVTQDRC